MMKKRLLPTVKLLLVATLLHAEPTALADESFLIFLAEMVEVDGQLTDPLDMAESSELDAEPVQGEESQAVNEEAQPE